MAEIPVYYRLYEMKGDVFKEFDHDENVILISADQQIIDFKKAVVAARKVEAGIRYHTNLAVFKSLTTLTSAPSDKLHISASLNSPDVGNRERPLIVVVHREVQESGIAALSAKLDELIVSSNEIKVTQNEVLAKIHEVLAEIHEVKAEMQFSKRLQVLEARLNDVSTPLLPADYMKDLRKKIKNLEIIFVPTEGAPPICTGLEASVLASFKGRGHVGEKKLVAAAFEVLKQLVPCSCLISSEDFPWLKTDTLSDKQQTPDGFCTHPGFYVYGKESRVVQEGSTVSIVCGKPADPSLYTSVKLLDFKTANDDNALCQAIIHLNHLKDRIGDELLRKPDSVELAVSRSTIVTRGALIHPEGLSLIHCVGSLPQSIVKMKWTDGGSADEFRKHFALDDPLGSAMSNILRMADATIVESTSNANCFLGAGSLGRVFRVNYKSQEMALKLVFGEAKVMALAEEHAIILDMNQKHVPHTVKAADASFFRTKVYGIDAAGYFMQPVGIELDRSLKGVKMALAALHEVHKHGFIHGDPRAPNILTSEKEVVFCACRKSARNLESSPNLKPQRDIKILLGSFNVSVADDFVARYKWDDDASLDSLLKNLKVSM